MLRLSGWRQHTVWLKKCYRTANEWERLKINLIVGFKRWEGQMAGRTLLYSTPPPLAWYRGNYQSGRQRV